MGNPEWNFEATFDIDENSAEGVNISVFDDDFGKDDYLGNKTMDIVVIQEKQKLLNQWITLENCKSGEVLLSAEFIPLASVQKGENIAKPVDSKSFEDDKKQIGPKITETIEVQDSKVVKQVIEESETTKENKTEIEAKTKEENKELVQDPKKTESIESVTKPVSTPKKILEPGQVHITVFKARDIEKKGKFGKADPYVKMTLGQQKAKSATVKNNHNPEWNFKASFDINESTTNEVSIELFDEDFGKDDTLGSTVLDLTQVQEKKQLLNQWIPLKNCKSGEVLISAEFIPQAAVQKQKESEPLESIAKQEDTQKSSEMTKQETHIEQSEKEILVKQETQIETSTKKGGKGLKEVLNKEKKVSSEVIVKSEPSNEPEVVIPKTKELEPGLITVTVHKARDIEKKGMFGKADPYVIMTYGDQKAKSKTIKNNYNPEWEFNAKFNIKKDAAEGIKISVFDDDIGKDDALGMKVLDIGSVQDYQQLKNQWIPLENCKSGEVLISAVFTPQALVDEAEKSVVVQSPAAETKDVAKAEPEDKKKKDVVKVEVEEASKTDAGKVKDLDVSKKPDAAAKPKHIFEAGRLIITVFKARDIEKKGMFGKADPYVHITLGKQKAKSKTVKNNHNPEWNFDATFEVDQNTPETMRVDVFDEDLGKDDILGHKVLDISTVLEKKKLQNEWIPLDNCKSGEILLSAEFIPIANIQQSKQVEEHVEEQPTPDKPEEKDTKPKETVQDSEKSIPAVQTSEKPKEM